MQMGVETAEANLRHGLHVPFPTTYQDEELNKRDGPRKARKAEELEGLRVRLLQLLVAANQSKGLWVVRTSAQKSCKSSQFLRRGALLLHVPSTYRPRSERLCCMPAGLLRLFWPLNSVTRAFFRKITWHRHGTLSHRSWR